MKPKLLSILAIVLLFTACSSDEDYLFNELKRLSIQEVQTQLI